MEKTSNGKRKETEKHPSAKGVMIKRNKGEKLSWVEKKTKIGRKNTKVRKPGVKGEIKGVWFGKDPGGRIRGNTGHQVSQKYKNHKTKASGDWKGVQSEATHPLRGETASGEKWWGATRGMGRVLLYLGSGATPKCWEAK